MMTDGGTELWRAGLSCVLLVLGVWLPGLALIRSIAGRRLTALVALALAPSVGGGLLYVSGQVLTRFDLPVDERLQCLMLLLTTPLLVRFRGEWRDYRVPPAVVVAWAAGALVWALGIRDLAAVAPHDDGYNHGLFLARVARFDTLDPKVVMPHDVVSGGHAVDFYPLALHQQAASMVSALNLDVATAWTVTTVLTIVFALPLGMFVLVRAFLPDQAKLWGRTALVAALLPGLTYSTSWWGGYVLAAGMAMAAGVLVCLVVAAREDWSWRTSLVAGIGLVGLAGVHTSEYTMVAALSGVLLVLAPLMKGRLLEASRGLAALSSAFAVSLVLLAPVLPQLARGVGERRYHEPLISIPLARSTLEVLFHYSFVRPSTPPAVVIAFWVGAVVCARRRWLLPWLGCWAAFALLYVWLARWPSALNIALTSSWYSDRFRVAYILAFVSIPIVAVALTGPPTKNNARRDLRGAASHLLTIVFVVTTGVVSVQAMHRNYEEFSLVGADERAAFSFLAERAGPGSRVLNHPENGSPWMYSLAGAAPVVALKTQGFERPEWDDAFYLIENIGRAGKDPRTDLLMRDLRVRFVYVNDRHFPESKTQIDRRDLERSPMFRLAFRRGGVRVYEFIQ